MTDPTTEFAHVLGLYERRSPMIDFIDEYSSSGVLVKDDWSKLKTTRKSGYLSSIKQPTDVTTVTTVTTVTRMACCEIHCLIK